VRIGQGVDVHAFDQIGSADSVRLGGVDIPHDRQLIAHSDGDVVLHALMDALLGAAALGDIGQHFSDTDPAYAGADSMALLKQVVQMIRAESYAIGNADITIAAERPKIAPHASNMRERIADALGVDQNQISVKATTTEGLGFVGRREGIAVTAVVLLE
jgi:2-C-methyl-D-erythritol 2,4-cyclodiphosphate synthase